MKKKIFNLRIFWYIDIEQLSDGYYYHRWTNNITGQSYAVFAGYIKRSMNKQSTSWKAVKKLLKKEYD